MEHVVTVRKLTRQTLNKGSFVLSKKVLAWPSTTLESLNHRFHTKNWITCSTCHTKTAKKKKLHPIILYKTKTAILPLYLLLVLNHVQSLDKPKNHFKCISNTMSSKAIFCTLNFEIIHNLYKDHLNARIERNSDI